MTQSVLVEPAFRSAPPSVQTFGPEVSDLAALAGLPPDPEQEMALDAIFAIGPDGKSAAFEFCVVCCRQNMKTGLFKMAALGWLYVTDQRLIVWSAHEMKTTKEAFLELVTMIENTPALSRRLASGPSHGIHRGNGDEAIELATGQRIMFKARTNGGGRGLSGDKVILDEAFALKPSHMGSLLPTLSARPDPQVVYGSSAGLTDSHVLRGIRDRGREPRADSRLAYLEWCDPDQNGCAAPGCEHKLGTPGCALDDRARWHQANPALGRRISVEYVAAERDALPPAEFARERLGWWDDPAGEAVVSPATWAECMDLDSVMTSAPTFALDVHPMRSWAAIDVAGTRADGLPMVEVTQNSGVVDHREGVEWVLPRLQGLKHRWPSMKLWIAAGSAAESLAPGIRAAGIDVEILPAAEVPAACGYFYDQVVSRHLRHVGQSELTTALEGAKQADVGDGAWKWARRKSATDISPLYAATIALWASQKRKPVPTVW